jgi:hypothetical protein
MQLRQGQQMALPFYYQVFEYLLYIATGYIYLISNEYLNRLSFLENICIEAEKLNI